MSTIGELLVLLGADPGPLAAGMAVGKREVKGFSDSVGHSARSAGKAMETAGLAVAGGAVAIGVASIDMAAKFQGSMTQVANNLNETAAQSAAMGRAVTAAALGTSSSSNTMAAALAPVAGELQRVAGGALTAAKAQQQLTAAQNLHEASGADLATSLKAITDLQLVYHQSTAQAESTATLLFQAQSQLGIGTDVLAGIMQRLQPKLAGSNMGLRDVLATVRMLEPVVGTGTRAITTVGVVLQGIVTPSLTATKALQKMGISLHDAHGKFIGMPAALSALQKALDKLPESVAPGSKAITKATLLYDLFGKQSAVGAELLRGGAAGIALNAKALDAQGTAAKAAERNSKTFSDQVETLKASIATAGTTIGTALLPVLAQLMNAVMPIINDVATWISNNPQLAGGIIAAAGAIGLMTAAAVALTLVLSANPIVLAIMAIVAAVAILATAWANDWGGIREKIGPIVNTIVGIIQGIVKVGQDVVATVSSIIDKSGILKTALQALGTAGDIARAVLGTIGDIIRTGIQPAIETFANFLSSSLSIALSALNVALQAIGTAFNAISTAVGFVLDKLGQLVSFIQQNAQTLSTLGQIASLGSGGLGVNLGQQVGANLFGPKTPSAAGAPGAAKIPHYALGGVVPGSGPLLAIVHGGEIIVPPGATVGAAPGILEPKHGVTSLSGAQGLAAAAASRVSGLASSIRLQAAQDAVTAAQHRLAHVLAEHLTKTRTAADKAAQVAAAHEKLRMAEERLTLVEDQQAATAAKSLAGTTARGTRGASTPGGGNAQLTAALTAFTAALIRAVQSGVPITLDYQSVGSLLDQGQYANAARVSSGFVTSGSPAG